MLFQKNALFDSLSVLDNLLFPMAERLGEKGASARDQAKRMLTEVGLSGTEDLFPDELSGGMQKRLGIARALVVRPEIILYDEPTAGLDPITSKRIAELILRLNMEHHSTLLTVTNDVTRAYQLADEIALLHGGEWIEGGAPEAVQRTSHPALRQFVYGLREGPLTSEV